MISGSVTVDMNMNDTRNVGLAVAVPIPQRASKTITYTDGVGAGNASRLYGATRTIPAGGSDVIALIGSLLDSYGGTISLARLKAIVIVNPPGNDPLVIGGGTNPATAIVNGTISVPGGGVLALATPDSVAYPITAGTAFNLRITGTVGQSYTIDLAGADV